MSRHAHPTPTARRPSPAAALAWVALLALGAGVRAAEEPPLPPGLDGDKPTTADEPALPEGLDGGAKKKEPTLPEGLGGTAKPAEPAKPPETPKDKTPELPFDLTGFWDLRGGFRVQDDDHEPDHSLGETRLQLELEKAFEEGPTLHLTADLLYDMSLNEHRVFMEEGRGLFDLREAWAAFRPTDFMDVKVGRQVLTWGTGDLWFLNDLFPKDWNSFLIGRDVEYLKAPSDAVKVSLFSDLANLDLVYTPRFDADRYIDGRYASYYNPLRGRRAGQDAIADAIRPDDWFDDDEFAARAYRNLGAYEAGLYGYYGYWKSPEGVDRSGPAFPGWPPTGRACAARWPAASATSRSSTTTRSRIAPATTRSSRTASFGCSSVTNRIWRESPGISPSARSTISRCVSTTTRGRPPARRSCRMQTANATWSPCASRNCC